MVRAFGPEHVERAARMHAASWSRRELSMKLGPAFIRDCFYSFISESQDAFGFVYEKEDGELAGCATALWDYEKFTADIAVARRAEIMRAMIGGVFTFKVGPYDVVNSFGDKKKLKNLRHVKWHLGAVTLAPEYKGTPEGRGALGEIFDNVFRTFREGGAPGCWSSNDKLNVPMTKYHLKLGFRQVDEVVMAGRRLLVFEKDF